ncbi:hypothetical protein U1Q18_048491, partial [Sarracenia purpurea var. burkii]
MLVTNGNSYWLSILARNPGTFSDMGLLLGEPFSVSYGVGAFSLLLSCFLCLPFLSLFPHPSLSIMACYGQGQGALLDIGPKGGAQ